MIYITSFPSVLSCCFFFLSLFFFNDTATTEIYTLSLHDALPIFLGRHDGDRDDDRRHGLGGCTRSEEHTSELQSPYDLVCRLLLEKKKKKKKKQKQKKKKKTKKNNMKQMTKNKKNTTM